MSNLLENAIHYSPGREAIEIELRVVQDGVEITVRDHGIGIAAEEHERVFERFYRGDDEAVRNVHGTGLGLSIVKSAIEAHGGTISVTAGAAAGAHHHSPSGPAAA